MLEILCKEVEDRMILCDIWHILYGHVIMIEKSCTLELFVVLYMMFVFEYLFL